jgi:hypothetical protein
VACVENDQLRTGRIEVLVASAKHNFIVLVASEPFPWSFEQLEKLSNDGVFKRFGDDTDHLGL